MTDDRFEDALANLDAGCLDSEDIPALREALLGHIARAAPTKHIVFKQMDWGWQVGDKNYKDWVGYELIHKLLCQPGKKIHIYDLTNKPHFENSRKASQKTIKRCVDALVETQPIIGFHLKSHIETGEFCSYSGSREWLL